LKKKYPVEEIIKKRASEKLFILPNYISVSRIFLLPFFSYFTIQFSKDIQNWKYLLLSLLILTFMFISDFLDGYFARKLKQETIVGQYLDPVCDKIVSIVSFAILVYYFGFPFLVLIFTFFREVIGVLVGTFLFYFRGTMGYPNFWGKLGVVIAAINIYWWLILSYIQNYFQINLPEILILFPVIAYMLVQFIGIRKYIKDYYPIFKS
jgi:CDP-diacylglycerol--glycerol-3-phosphate 3-phosphatidyltransferase